MFNDLTGNQKSLSSGVDDIFAETDKTSAVGNNIQTRQVGLSAFSEAPSTQGGEASAVSDVEAEKPGGGKFLKIAIFAVLAAILILGAYLIYTNFLSNEAKIVVDKNEAAVVDSAANQAGAVDTQVDTETNNQNNQEDFIVPIMDQNEFPGGDDSVEPMTEVPAETDPATVDSDGDGLSDYDEINIYGTNPNLIDTDFDGLTDYEEVMTHKTNPLKLDTDTDGLSDYEEIKIYGTDPLKLDTDGDGYSDGDEVKAGYDPLDAGGGRLPGL